GKRRYKADKIETFTHTLVPPDKAVTLRERLLQVRNDTELPIVVQGMALSRLPGDRQAWVNSVRMLVKPGETGTLKPADRHPLHGSRARVVGQDRAAQALRWTRDRALAARDLARDGYKATEVAPARFILQPPAAAPPAKEANGVPQFPLQADQVFLPDLTGKT